MKMAKQALAALSVMVFLIAGCGSSPSSSSGSSASDELDSAIRDASDYLNENIPKGNKIVILNIQSDSPALSDYIIDELIANAVNDRIFSVVDRQQLDMIRSEQNLQLSGEVDDNAAVEIGKFFGAQTIVSGGISPLGERYRLRIRALEVQTAQVQGQYNRNMTPGPILNDLVKSGGGTGARTAAASGGSAQAIPAQSSNQAQPSAPAPAEPALPAYKIGDTGPAGGLIFYDKGNNSGGWRYLEAAPVEAEFQAKWSETYFTIANDYTKTEIDIGYGKKNTELIVEKFREVTGNWNTPAQKSFDLTLNGFDDWFLPSQAELDQIFGSLKRRNLGDFKDQWYWSSTEANYYSAYRQNFKDGKSDFGSGNDLNKTTICFVRPIRQVAGPGAARSSVDGNGGVAGTTTGTTTGTSGGSGKANTAMVWRIVLGIVFVGALGYLGYVIFSNSNSDSGSRAVMATP